jgi:phosphate transport system substrate-binding protein
MEFMSDAAAGRGGYLQDRGLVPMPAAQLATQQAVARGMTVMTAPTE